VLSLVAGSPFNVGGIAGPSAFSPSGQLLASGNDIDGTTSMMTVGSDGALSPIPGSPFLTIEPNIFVAFSPSGQFLAGTSLLSVATYSIADGAPTPAGSFLDNQILGNVAWSPTGGLIAVPESENSSVVMLSVAANGALTRIMPNVSTGPGTQPVNLAFSPSGSVLAVANGIPTDADGINAVSLFSVAANGSLTTLAGSPVTTDRAAVDVAFNPSGSLLAVAEETPDGSGGYAGEVGMYSVGAGGQLTQAPGSPVALAGASEALSFSPDGRLLAVDSRYSGTVSMFWVGSDGRLTQTAGSPFSPGPNLIPLQAVFSPNGGLIAAPLGATPIQADWNDVAMFAVNEPTTGSLENTAPPKLYGDASAGHRVLVGNGRWQTTSHLSYSFSWELCTAANDTGCAPLTGGIGRISPKLTSADAGSYLTAEVIATNGTGESAETFASELIPG
jgi:WD40 repeat protein